MDEIEVTPGAAPATVAIRLREQRIQATYAEFAEIIERCLEALARIATTAEKASGESRRTPLANDYALVPADMNAEALAGGDQLPTTLRFGPVSLQFVMPGAMVATYCIQASREVLGADQRPPGPLS